MQARGSYGGSVRFIWCNCDGNVVLFVASAGMARMSGWIDDILRSWTAIPMHVITVFNSRMYNALKSSRYIISVTCG